VNDAHDYDVLVVGGGISGLTAANRAVQQGLKVAVLERGADESYLCNSRYSGGIFHVAFRNVKDRPEELLEAIEEATRGEADPALAQALASTCGRAVDWLREEGAKFMRVGHIAWQQWVLAPPRRIAPGLDWKGRGADFTLRALANNFSGRGGVMLRGTAATALMEKAGRCIGVEAQSAQGAQQLTARAIVLADGGFQGNPGLVRQHISNAPERIQQRGAGTGVGNGLCMAREVGAHITELGSFYGHTLSRDALTRDVLWPYPQLDELCKAGVVVDVAGNRFADEGRGGVYLSNAIAKLPDPLSAWVIFDQAIWERAGRHGVIPANPHLIAAGGTLVRANTVRELAAQANIAADALEATVTAYDSALKAGCAQGLEPPRTLNADALPIGQPPFYAAPLCAGITYTFGGIATDEHGRVLARDGSRIAGLYASGATTGGLEGGRHCGYVGGLIKSVAFGLRAAEHVAQSITGGCPAEDKRR
jgi:fumarate reductase flavoprotein subunit